MLWGRTNFYKPPRRRWLQTRLPHHPCRLRLRRRHHPPHLSAAVLRVFAVPESLLLPPPKRCNRSAMQQRHHRQLLQQLLLLLLSATRLPLLLPWQSGSATRCSSPALLYWASMSLLSYLLHWPNRICQHRGLPTSTARSFAFHEPLSLALATSPTAHPDARRLVAVHHALARLSAAEAEHERQVAALSNAARKQKSSKVRVALAAAAVHAASVALSEAISGEAVGVAVVTAAGIGGKLGHVEAGAARGPLAEELSSLAEYALEVRRTTRAAAAAAARLCVSNLFPAFVL